MILIHYINNKYKVKMEKEVNIAPSSVEGHFVRGAKEVIFLDKVTESFKVKGKSKLVTKNHTTLELAEDCLLSCQTVYNPFSKMYEKSKD